jgi:hypothetical protein
MSTVPAVTTATIIAGTEVTAASGTVSAEMTVTGDASRVGVSTMASHTIAASLTVTSDSANVTGFETMTGSANTGCDAIMADCTAASKAIASALGDWTANYDNGDCGRAPPMTDLLAHLEGVRSSGDGWTARCPAHSDRHNSLNIHHRDGRWLLKCHAGCDWQAIVDALHIDAADLFDREEGEWGRLNHANNRATAQPTAKSSETFAGSPLPEDKVPAQPEGTRTHPGSVRSREKAADGFPQGLRPIGVHLRP